MSQIHSLWGSPAEYRRRLAIRSSGRILLLKVVEIDWIEAADNYVNIHSGGREYLMRESMNEIEARLDPGQFLRIHRCAIVNMDRVREIRPAPNGESSSSVILKDGTTLRMSRGRRDKMEELLTNNYETNPSLARDHKTQDRLASLRAFPV